LGKPLIFAIENFYPGALHFSDSTLSNYLFGLSSHSYHNADGKLIVTHTPIDKHKSGAKEIPSGFFAQPNAEKCLGRSVQQQRNDPEIQPDGAPGGIS